MKTRHVIIKGKVQGVFFRDYTKNQAMTLKIMGWVRNLADGSVECLLTGRQEQMALMLDWLWQGSPMSNVLNVIVSELPLDETFTSFEIRR